MIQTSKLFIVLFFLVVSFTTSAQLSKSNSALLKAELELIINMYRLENGLDALNSDPILEKAAANQCDYMVKFDTLTHAQKKGTLKTPEKRVKFFKGKEFEMIGENILYQDVESFKVSKKDIPQLAQSIFLQWKNSPRHNSNMLGTEYTYSGISFKEDVKKNRIFVAQVFARKGFIMEGQLSSNGFGLRNAPYDCPDRYGNMSNVIMNIGNHILIEDGELVFYFHDIELFKRLFPASNDGLALDLLFRNQFPCSGPNQLDASPVYDGILLKPVFREEILAKNRAENPLHIVSPIGKLPADFIRLTRENFSISTLIIKDGKVCQYLVECMVPAEDYELLPVEPKLIDPPNVQPSGNGADRIEQLSYEFHASDVNSIKLPALPKGKGKISGITIQSYSSIEGDSTSNANLHKQRAAAINSDLMSRLDVKASQIRVDSKENWEKMYFQLYYAGADSLAALSKDSIRSLIASKDSSLNWDSLLFVQRISVATIYYLADVKTKMTPIEQMTAQLGQAIAETNDPMANKCLKRMYDSDELEPSLFFENGIFEVFKNRPELVQNSAAVLSKFCTEDLLKSTEFVFSWIHRQDELSEDARHNLLILYTILGVEFLDRWDVSSKKLANVVHPKRMNLLFPTNIQSELLLNTNLVYIRYFGQINDGENLEKAFDFIADYFMENALSDEDELKIALFFNNWSRYDLTIRFLLSKYKESNLEENMLLTLAMTLHFYEREHVLFNEINEEMLNLNKARWCDWIWKDIQTRRNPKIKSLYCEHCEP